MPGSSSAKDALRSSDSQDGERQAASAAPASAGGLLLFADYNDRGGLDNPVPPSVPMDIAQDHTKRLSEAFDNVAEAAERGAPSSEIARGSGTIAQTELREAAGGWLLADASDHEWLASLQPPAGVLPSVGEWSGDAPWLERGLEIVATKDLPMMRIMGEFSSMLMLARRLGAPPGHDADVDLLWETFRENCEEEDEEDGEEEENWADQCIEFILNRKMAGADASRRAAADAELRELYDPSRGLVRLRLLAHEFWPRTAAPPHRRRPVHPGDTPKCWAWCGPPRAAAAAPRAAHIDAAFRRAQGRVGPARGLQPAVGGDAGAPFREQSARGAQDA